MRHLEESKTALFSVIALIGAFALFLFRKKPKENVILVDNDVIQESTPDNGVPVKALTGDASRLYTAFGFDFVFGLYFPWEDENAIILILQSYTQPEFVELQKVYTKQYNRILRDDLKRYLSKSQLGKISHLII